MWRRGEGWYRHAKEKRGASEGSDSSEELSSFFTTRLARKISYLIPSHTSHSLCSKLVKTPESQSETLETSLWTESVSVAYETGRPTLQAL